MSKLACFSIKSCIAWSILFLESSFAYFCKYLLVTQEIMFSTLVSEDSPVRISASVLLTDSSYLFAGSFSPASVPAGRFAWRYLARLIMLRYNIKNSSWSPPSKSLFSSALIWLIRSKSSTSSSPYSDLASEWILLWWLALSLSWLWTPSDLIRLPKRRRLLMPVVPLRFFWLF